MSEEEAKNRTYQEANGVYNAGVLSHFACGRQRRILLKSQADGILANDNSDFGLRILPLTPPPNGSRIAPRYSTSALQKALQVRPRQDPNIAREELSGKIQI